MHRRPSPLATTTPRHGVARVLSKLGLCSRTQAAAWVRAGRVAVNGRVVTDPEFPPLPPKDWAVNGTRSGTGESVSVTSLGTAKPHQRNYGQEGKAQYIATKMPFMEREARAEVGLVDDAETVIVSFGSRGLKRMTPSGER